MANFEFPTSKNQKLQSTGPKKLWGKQILQTIQKGIDLQRKGLFPEAEYQYQLVLYNEPQNAEALNLMGTLSIEAKLTKTAINYMGKAVKLAPKNAVYHNNLGNAYLQQRNFILARKHLNKAIMLDQRFVEPLCNLGKAYKLMLKGHEGEKTYLRALKLKPNSEIALVGIAELILDNGRPLEAATYFRKALEANPTSVAALTGLIATQKFKAKAPETNMVLNLIKQQNINEQDLIRLHHAAGKILNDQGEYKQAISHYSRAKEISKNSFNIEMHEQLYSSFITCFDAQFFADRQDFGDPSERPVFIIGMPRSGTTLTEQICASHQDVYGAGELGNMRKLANEIGFADVNPQVFVDKIRSMTKEKSVELAQKYLTSLKNLTSLKKKNRSALRIVDKMPHNYEFAALITLLFPNARLVNCNRDAMDNCVSCFMHNFSEAHGYNANLTTVGLYYRQYHRLMSHWNDVIPRPILKMQYEETVVNFDIRARTLIEFIGLDWDEACLQFHKTERTVLTPSRWQVRQPIYTTSIKRWKRYGESLNPLRVALGELVED